MGMDNSSPVNYPWTPVNEPTEGLTVNEEGWNRNTNYKKIDDGISHPEDQTSQKFVENFRWTSSCEGFVGTLPPPNDVWTPTQIRTRANPILFVPFLKSWSYLKINYIYYFPREPNLWCDSGVVSKSPYKRRFLTKRGKERVPGIVLCVEGRCYTTILHGRM